MVQKVYIKNRPRNAGVIENKVSRFMAHGVDVNRLTNISRTSMARRMGPTALACRPDMVHGGFRTVIDGRTLT